MPRIVPRVGPRGHRYKLTLNYPIPHGSIACEPDTLDHPAGMRVLVTAIPDEGWEFWRWRDALTDNVNPGVVVMQGHKNLVAQFREAE